MQATTTPAAPAAPAAPGGSARRLHILKDDLVRELCDLSFALSASEAYLTQAQATTALRRRARSLGWNDVTNQVVAGACRPAIPVERQVWLSGPRFSAVLAWFDDRFVIDSITASGTLTMYMPSVYRRDHALPAIGFSNDTADDTAVAALPIEVAEFKRLMRQHVQERSARARILAAYAALHETFGLQLHSV